MADLAVQKVTLAGVSPTYAAADSAGDAFKNDGGIILHFVNADTTAKTVTVDSVQPCDQGFDHDLVLTIPASGELKSGPFPTRRFNDQNGNVNFTYDDVTSLTVGAFKE